jgi:hypothetical protein
MKALPAFAALALLCALSPLAGADEAGDAPPTGLRSEPKVEHTVIEDEGARIEELRVRGQTQRISVTPKGAIKQGYEIIPADGARDMSESASSSRGAAGKRVWRVLTF